MSVRDFANYGKETLLPPLPTKNDAQTEIKNLIKDLRKWGAMWHPFPYSPPRAWLPQFKERDHSVNGGEKGIGPFNYLSKLLF